MTSDPASFCRELEAYLCRKNDGHLIRIVGPAFETVCGWAAQGMPLTVVERGIDACFERYYAKGPRRRPVRIEFCEADVLDEFDRWRRAVGLTAAAEGAVPAGAEGGASRPSLPRHLDRVLARLTAVRAGRPSTAQFAEAVDRIIDELDGLRAKAKGLRGDAREQARARLAALDRELVAAARRELDAERDALTREAEAELQPFRTRMTAEVWRASLAAAVDRLVRARLGLPGIELT
jgi:hypothetical protein